MTAEPKHPHDDAPLTGAQVARLFGLEELRAGRHYLRDADRARVGSVWVQSLWHAEVVPSFHARSVLCVICAKGETFRNSATPDWHRAAFATPFQSAVVEVDRDPVADALSGFDLFRPGGAVSLDGIGYKVVFETLEMRGSLSFGNPSQPDLVALESALYSLASLVARRSNVIELAQAVDMWNEYIGSRVGRGLTSL
jgi:hypothetical protein